MHPIWSKIRHLVLKNHCVFWWSEKRSVVKFFWEYFQRDSINSWSNPHVLFKFIPKTFPNMLISRQDRIPCLLFFSNENWCILNNQIFYGIVDRLCNNTEIPRLTYLSTGTCRDNFVNFRTILLIGSFSETLCNFCFLNITLGRSRYLHVRVFPLWVLFAPLILNLKKIFGSSITKFFILIFLFLSIAFSPEFNPSCSQSYSIKTGKVSQSLVKIVNKECTRFLGTRTAGKNKTSQSWETKTVRVILAYLPA